MSKRNTPSKRSPNAGKSRGTRPDSTRQGIAKEIAWTEVVRRHLPSQAAVREGVHLVVETLVLVFLIITFEARAFVIPTGSLAPTLMGRHKDLECPQCGYPYRVGASGEVDPNTGGSRGMAYRVEGCTCPMCRFTMDLGPDNPQRKTYRSFNGDRILVSKIAYQIAQPERWDIAPFRFPGKATTNYIKRIVGLPGETVRISHGDIFIRRSGQQRLTIARKPPSKLLAMAQPVYDNDYVLAEILALGWPGRWHSWPGADDAAGGWVTSEDYRRFRTDGTGFPADGTVAGEAWLRYQHFVPSYHDWRHLLAGSLPAAAPRPQLISDFCAYNTGRSRASIEYSRAPGLEGLGLHWVGDLVVQCTMEVEGNSGQAVFELVEGGRRFQCRIDVATGVARLSIDGLDSFGPEAFTGVRGPGSYQIIFSNVDDELMLWVDGSVVQFDPPTRYGSLDNARPQPADLAPVGIGSRGAALRISHLKLFRDVYYIAERDGGRNGLLSDFDDLASAYRRLSPDDVARFLADPRSWDAFERTHSVEFGLDADQFLVLGDNSAGSNDSRLWEREGLEYYVSRELLIGKALCVVWPHSWHKIPGTEIPFPCFPNLRRMRFVR